MKCKIFKDNLIVSTENSASLKKKLITIPIDNHAFFITIKNDEFLLNVKSELGNDIIAKSKESDNILTTMTLIEKKLKLHFAYTKIQSVLKMLYLITFPLLLITFILSINGIAQNFLYQHNTIAQTENIPVQPASLTPMTSTHPSTPSTNNDAVNMLASLKKAAATKKFTVTLSSGKEHTLYVFSDPHCPYCQKIEPKLQKLAQTFNIEIFPVSVIGGTQSERDITQILAQPGQARQTLWRTLITGEKIAASEANYAQYAESVNMNNLAFAMLGFDGTPTILSEKGYQIPLSLIDDAKQLHTLIQGQP